MKPRIIIIIVVVIILICIGVYFYFAGISNSPSPVANTGSVGGGKEVVIPAVQAFPSTPTSATLAIGTPKGVVQVNNFYLSNPLVTDGGETVIIASTTDYMITYDTTDSSFWIGVDAAQFNTIRPVAEQAFLSTLGTSSTNACKLNVSVGVFYDASSSLSGKSFPLSFCGSLNFTQ